MKARRLTVLFALAATACGSSAVPARMLCEGAPSEATITDLVIGTGPTGFRPLSEGAVTYM